MIKVSPGTSLLIALRRVLYIALPPLLGAAMGRWWPSPAPMGLSPAIWDAAVHGAELELLCRSLAALEPVDPAQGGQTPAAAEPAQSAAEAPHRQQQHPRQRQEAFDAMLVHISAYCHVLTAPAAGHTFDGDGETTPPAETGARAAAQAAPDAAAGNQTAAEAVGADTGGDSAEGGEPSPGRLAVLLAQRAFGELAAAVTAAAAQGLACGRAQTLLLHLLKATFPVRSRVVIRLCCSCGSQKLPHGCLLGGMRFHAWGGCGGLDTDQCRLVSPCRCAASRRSSAVVVAAA